MVYGHLIFVKAKTANDDDSKLHKNYIYVNIFHTIVAYQKYWFQLITHCVRQDMFVLIFRVRAHSGPQAKRSLTKVTRKTVCISLNYISRGFRNSLPSNHISSLFGDIHVLMLWKKYIEHLS